MRLERQTEKKSEEQQTKEQQQQSEQQNQREQQIAQQTKQTEISWFPKFGEKVGVFFEHRDDEGNVIDSGGRNWYCGKVTKSDKPNKRVFVEFLQGSDEGWYPVNHEMRKCPPNHTCVAEVCYKLLEDEWKIGRRVRDIDTGELGTIRRSKNKKVTIWWEERKKIEDCEKKNLVLTREEKRNCKKVNRRVRTKGEKEDRRL